MRKIYKALTVFAIFVSLGFLVGCGEDSLARPPGEPLSSVEGSVEEYISVVTIDGKECLWYQKDEGTYNGYKVTIVAFDCDWSEK